MSLLALSTIIKSAPGVKAAPGVPWGGTSRTDGVLGWICVKDRPVALNFLLLSIFFKFRSFKAKLFSAILNWKLRPLVFFLTELNEQYSVKPPIS